MKKVIVIIVFIIAGVVFYRMFTQHEARGRAAAAERARLEEVRAREKSEAEAREKAEQERLERERAAQEAAAKAAEAKRREEEARALKLAREKLEREAAEQEAVREKERTRRKFVNDNIAFFAAGKFTFAAKAAKSDRLGGSPVKTTFRIGVPKDGNELRICSLTLEKGKLIEGHELQAEGTTPLSVADFKAMVKSVAWLSRREGSEITVVNSPTGGKGAVAIEGGVINVGKADLGGIAQLFANSENEPKLDYALTLSLKPYGKLDLGKVGFLEAVSTEALGEKVRSAIHARILADKKKYDSQFTITFTDGKQLVKHGKRIEVPRRFLRDHQKDIRAGKSGRKVDWALIRETRRRDRQEWLDYYEEADRRERGIDKPYEIVVPEGDIARALQSGVFTYAPVK